MFISRTPLRVSLLGGGTDFPSYYNEHGGLCLSATIDKYVYVIVKARHDDSIRVSYTQTEIVGCLDDLKHDLIREALRVMGVTAGVEVVTMADIPGHGSGLASSSAVTVGALYALGEYAGRFDGAEDSRVRAELARLAIRIEGDVLRKTPGQQDQYSVSWGGMNLIKFERDAVEMREVSAPLGRWQRGLLLFQAPTSKRDSSHILNDQEARAGDNIADLTSMALLANTAVVCLENREYDELGPLLDSAWNLKRTLSPYITTPRIDEMYEAAKDAGCTGGKLCGAGGGGHMLLYCPGGTADAVRAAMADYGREVTFNFEYEGAVCRPLF